jgi:hypothetical protein
MTHTIDNTKSNNYSQSVTILDRCRAITVVSLGFWISTSLLIDLIVMPMLWATGMMESNGFASAGYSLFWVFNRIEVICAAAALSSIWALGTRDRYSVYGSAKMRAGALMLLAISLSYTFILSPYMSGLGMDLDILDVVKSIPAEMNQAHSMYWVLEASKLGIAGMLLAWCDK